MVILDSSFLIAYHNKQGVHHSAAAKLMDSVVNGEWESLSWNKFSWRS